MLQGGFEMQPAAKQRSAADAWEDMEDGGFHDALAQAASLLKRPEEL